MKTYSLKSISKPVSAIGLGTMIFHPDTKKRDFSLLNAFVDNGGTYIDTAEVYGAVEEHGYSEMVIGDWLEASPEIRENIVLATKGLITGYCAPLHPGGAKVNPESVHRAIDGSLKRLKTDYLDIWMFHRDDLSQPVGPLVDALDEEVKKGRIRAYGASNWSTERIQEAIDYARANGKAEMMSSSPHFSLAKANEPFWPETVVTSEKDKQWFTQNDFPLVAWSALGRGFFAKGDRQDTSDEDLVRVFYSDDNFERKERATELALHKNLNMFEMALAYVLNQPFPVIALNGAETPEQVKNSLHAASLTLTQAEVDWLDLTSDNKPF
ncbi:aldo/keto reductase [Vibrio sp. SCSIO 43132]|uniref:aldo/keto reductase n=1 Tax=Vibrio sp. SCSIO 43132 TaxID=2779363 RepID=UPI001CAA2B18|nr:aldo/keto reductase [Vibrio sp. SCSIO 43132]UAB72257.1 aldo/keto reductase [Vibrio sp. SCSIO 43132]